MGKFDKMKQLIKITSTVLSIAIILLAAILFSCQEKKQDKQSAQQIKAERLIHPDWSKNANIYEVNVRQFTEEGTLQAFEEHLPRLKDMGIKILWFMPIHPIGEKNRKGTLGSYYSVQDYKAVNPEFGTFDEFKAVVKKAHDMGFKVILDWVANHSAWDNPWIESNPEWYTVDSAGNMVSPFDWSDVADLNYEKVELQDIMIDALKFWVTEADIDGYRCDVAGMVPTEFWNRARKELDEIKPVFMLAEAEQADHHDKAFDMSYAWELHHILNKIAIGEKNVNDIDNYLKKNDSIYPSDAYRMAFISNHDENSWNGTVEERLGDAAGAMAVLTFTLPGMPLIYSGQEAGLNKRLEFFKKDKIDWDTGSSLPEFYKKLNLLKKDNPALWNGDFGGSFKRINTSDEHIYAFIREKDGNKVFVITNLSENDISSSLQGNSYTGNYLDLFTDEEINFTENTTPEIAPWEYKVYVSK